MSGDVPDVTPAAQTTVDLDDFLEEPEADEKLQTGDLARLWRFLAPFARANRWQALMLLIVIMIETAFEAVFPLAQRHIIDKGLIEKNVDVIIAVIAFLAVSAIIVNGLGFIIDVIYSKFAADLIGDMREAMHAHLLRMHADYLLTTPRGATLSRFSGDLQSIEQCLVEVVPWLIHPLLQITYSTVLMFYFNVWLGCLSALIFPIVLLLPRRIARGAFTLSYAKRQREAALLGNLQETLSAAAIVQAFRLEDVRARRFQRLNRLWRIVSFRTIFMGAMVERTAFATLYILHVAVFAAGVWAVHADAMSLGTLVAYEALFLSMGEALTYATQFVPRIANAAGSVRHISELTDAAPAIADRPDAVAIDAFQGQIKLTNVARTHGDARFSLTGINLTIPAGSRVAIVGASGAGKSTLLGLLMRFRDPTSGAITIDGRDLRAATLASYRGLIGYVPQEPAIFEGTIGANIALGGQRPSSVRIKSAAAQAGIASYVEALPKGYNTPVGELGNALSVGQRQRLAIARALVRNPQILILDEPTSALDPETESRINETLWRVAEGRTLICATHKLAGIVGHADMIIVMHEGTIVETGTHAALLAADGHYAQLWRNLASAPA